MVNKPYDRHAFAAFHDTDFQEGLTTREYYAGQALAGLMGDSTKGYLHDVEKARYCFRLADAMIAESGRKREQSGEK